MLIKAGAAVVKTISSLECRANTNRRFWVSCGMSSYVRTCRFVRHPLDLTAFFARFFVLFFQLPGIWSRVRQPGIQSFSKFCPAAGHIASSFFKIMIKSLNKIDPMSQRLNSPKPLGWPDTHTKVCLVFSNFHSLFKLVERKTFLAHKLTKRVFIDS